MSHPLERRLGALVEAVAVAEGRLDPALVDVARAVAERGSARAGLGLDATVAALAGPTGAGKSSLFNALAGAELSSAGVRRPTTASASAAIWGEPDERLLDWLDVPRRHRIGPARSGELILLDLPDFDSVEASHRTEFERVLELVDLVVWVADPQKYADSALHDRYLVPLARHAATTIVVLNQADLLEPEALAACRSDLGRLLEADGLQRVPVLAVSARTGDGVSELWSLVEKRVAARKAALERLAADVGAAAESMAAACEGPTRPRVGRTETARLSAALADAAGLPVVTDAVERSHRRRGALATGWPFVRWVRRLRPDPLRRLHLGDADVPDADVRTSLPEAGGVQRAQVFEAARALADAATEGLTEPWPRLARHASTANEQRLAGELDRAVAGTDLRMRKPRWWAVAGVLQTALAACVGIAVVWLLVLAALGWLRLDDVIPLPKVHGVPWPTLLLVGAVLAGLLLALFARMANRAGARRRARRAAAAIRRRVDTVAAESVIGPVEAELEARKRLCEAVAVAARSRR